MDQLGLPFEPEPDSMLDLGWSCAHGKAGTLVWTHETGAKVEEDWDALEGRPRRRVNGGEWRTGLGFTEALEEALK